MANGGEQKPSSFYIASSSEPQPPLAYLAQPSNQHGSSVDGHAVGHSSSATLPLPSVATAPQLDAVSQGLDSESDDDLSPFRPRSFSAPSVLYYQVALQLRSISDDFNSEYDQTVTPPPQRRVSLPNDLSQHQPRQSPGWLHGMIQSLRRNHASPRSHHLSISRVPEEMADSENDETCQSDNKR